MQLTVEKTSARMRDKLVVYLLRLVKDARIICPVKSFKSNVTRDNHLLHLIDRRVIE
jgi:hypothetical protein